MHIGVVLPQSDWKETLETARHAEEIGCDSVWVVDHLLSFPAERGILEAFTTLSALAASTQRVQIGAQVFCQSFRNPALFAKMAATLDTISNGRLRLLVGAGWFETEYQQYNYEFPPPGTLVEQLQDTIQIFKGMLGGIGPFTYEGKHYSVHEVINAPLTRPGIPIEVGGGRNRVMQTIAKQADGWNCPAIALGMLDDRLAYLEKQCEKRGRSIKALHLSCQIACAIDDEEAASSPPVSMFDPSNGFVGSVQQSIDKANELMSKGITDFNVVVARGERGRASLQRLVNEVRPKVS
jgi:alkanesulfonate monooxygenase SsuD/methylene tetrahydromethanopterin reductase-like flavin-dependent oxidoreductase (luciferase family)